MGTHYGTKIVRDGLVLHLDAANPRSYSGTGTDWFDLSGNNNHGTLVNGPVYNTDNAGTFVFDGANDYANVLGDYHLQTEGTVDFWVKPANTIQGSRTGGRPFGKGNNFEARFDGGGGPVGTLIFDLGGNNSLITTTNSWSNAIWYNVTLLFDTTTGTSSVYVQSELDATGSIGSITNQTGFLEIGKTSSGFGSPFVGSISNFKFYDRVLTQTEIQQNFNAMKGRYGL